MGRYVQINTDVLKEHLNQQLGKLHGMIKNNWRQALKVLIRKFKQRAIESATSLVIQKLSPSLCENTSDIAKGVEQTNEFMQGVSGSLSKLTGMAGKILGPISKLLGIIKMIIALPIPTSVPPGIGITISVGEGFDEIKSTLKEFVNKAENLAASISHAVATVSAVNSALSMVLDRLNDLMAFATSFCELTDAFADSLENGTDVGALDQDLLDEYGNILFEMANSLEALLDGTDDGSGFDNASQDMLELIEDYAIEAFIPEGIKSRLRRRRIDDNFGTTGGDGVNAGDGTGLNLGPDGLPLGDANNQGINLPDQNSELYEAIDGIVYILKVEEDPTSPEIAQRRYGVAQTLENVTVLKSPPTFTTKSKTILADIKVRLDTQLSIL
jgi:hypothetical protein